jgi:hypothetical protein
VQVGACRADVAVPKRRLDPGKAGASIDGMRAIRVRLNQAQPRHSPREGTSAAYSAALTGADLVDSVDFQFLSTGNTSLAKSFKPRSDTA